MGKDRVSPALERVLIKYQAMVQRIAYRHGLDEASVDDVFQEVRIRLWKALEQGEKIGEVPTSYIYRTATSAALDVIRRRRAYPTEELDLHRASNPALATPDPGPDALMVGAEVVTAITQAVDALIESRRPVVRMYLMGYGMDEIAGLLGWSSAKVRNLLYRGLADLRSRLTEDGVGPGAIE